MTSRFALCCAVLAVALLWPALALAQPIAPDTGVSVFALLLPGIIALSAQVATALRDALSRQVPPRWCTASPQMRPWYAALAGALVAFLSTLGAATATVPAVGSTAIVAALGAAFANLAITVPKLIYAESQA